MTTKLYLTNANPPAGVSAYTVGGWSATTGVAVRGLYDEPSGSSTTASASETSSSSSWSNLLGHFTSEPFLSDGTFEGDFTLVMGVRESSTSANFYGRIKVVIASNDGTSLRLAYDSGEGSVGSEWPTTAAARTFTGTVNPISVSAGERILLEVGYNARNTSTSTFTGYINYGGTSSTDLVSGNTGSSLTSRPGWIEFTDIDELFTEPVDPTVPMWVADAETGDFTGFYDPSGGIDVLSPQTRSVVTDPVRDGNYAYEFEINGVASNNSQRAEAVPSTWGITAGERWFSFSVYLPPGFQTNVQKYDVWQAVAQWRHGGSSGSPPLQLDVLENQFFLAGGNGPNGEAYLDPESLGVAATTGVWHDFLFHILFDSNPAVGYVEIWHNGVKVLGPFYPPGGTKYDEGSTEGYLKMGVYRSPDIEVTSASRVYHDTWKMGLTREAVERESYASIVAPDEFLFFFGGL